MGLRKFEKQQSHGLAALLTGASETLAGAEVPSPQSTAEDVSAVIAYILDTEDVVDVTRSDGFADIASIFERRLSSLGGTAGTSGRAEAEAEEAAAEDASGSSSSAGEPSLKETAPVASNAPVVSNGRLGPPKVSLDRSSVSGQFTCSEGELALESLSNFSSCRANVCCFKGKWMYEATLGTAGIQQLGWATINCPFTSEEGVGDAPDSYAYDGKRVKKWNEKCTAYGVTWAPNDVISCCLDLDQRQVTFYRNGLSLGVAFESIRTMKPSLAYFPAVSLSQNEKCELNFGSRPFLYPVEGFEPLQAAPSAADQETATYLLSCLQRLVRIVAGSEEWEASNVLMPRTSLPWDDAVLVASLLSEKLASLLMQEYLVQSQFLPFLLELHHKREPHRSNCVLAALSLLQLTLPAEVLHSFVPVLMQALSLRSRTSLSQPSQFPYTASYPYLALAATLMHNSHVRDVWMEQRDFHSILEGFLTRKQQTPEDLKGLIPNIWWPGINDSQASEEQLTSTTQALTVALGKIEDKQYELVAALTAAPNSTENRFLAFLEYVLHKNQGATRDIQPPGLSDSTVLSSLFFVLLRVLQPYLEQATAGEGPLAAFPAAKLFVQTSEADAGNVMTELGRLGGIVSHLQREVQLKAEDWKPCDIRPPPPLHQATPAPAPTSLPPSCLPQLANTAMVLYSWRISVHIKMAQNCASQMQNAINAMAEIERHMERNLQRSGEFQRYAADLKEEAATNLRYLTQLKVGLLSGWKQEGLFNLATYVSTLLLQLAEGERALLCYVPVCYMESVLDCLHVLLKVEPALASPALLLPAGLGCMLSLLMFAFNSKSIANPDVKEAVLQTTTLLLDAQEFREVMEATPAVLSRLVPATVECFDSRLWHAASNILLRLIKGSGFGQGPHPQHLLVFQSALRDVCSAPAPSFQPFLHRLFNTLNWSITEVSVTVSELSENRVGRNTELMQQQTRKTATLMDLSGNLLRILEFVACHSSKAFLADVSLNLARLLELVAFLLSRYPRGPDARKLAELMRPSQRTAPYMEKVSVPQVLAPVLGMLLGLAQADKDSDAPVFISQLMQVGGGVVAKMLPALREMDWATAFPQDPSLPQQLDTFQQLAVQVREARTQWEAAQPEAGSSEEDVPEEFLDPITMTVMADPVVLPDSQVTVDRTTIQRHLLSQPTDPFSRKELTLAMVQPNTGLAERIREWKQASSGKAAVKNVLEGMEVD